ncbi:flavodoxin [Brevibacillus laterosporus]|uniref:flavodoxin n=1 Tax=Brevibacillus laterosporus TaxID=1465 RepID=UPI00036678D0|nr:flavodoxin [Brevibacillus laterosporus]ATO49009.1 flavodoxin [Brevibacillus laterosporus DSM 25]MBG9803325.1 flavodoxin [Brevibacillus laterosporus]MED2001917.1 flavodoxin [Brevibacillus laterosporus]MED4765909.1 flavodoxin [Brevibacillus laterosporus]TPH09216.1 flavodoxin [Brevibacillus laterosporus]
MSKIGMIYASMTGNTEEMAELIAGSIREQGVEIEVKEVWNAKAADLVEYDAILLGAYTWGDGDLPDEFLDFYDEMDGLDLSGKKAAVFGSGDTSYPMFGEAVETLTKKLQSLGAEIVLEGLKVELSPGDKEIEECKEFGSIFAQKLG